MINGQFVVVIVIEGIFQGGSMGEVFGVKMVVVLELVVEDNCNGILMQVVLCFEIGGVCLQEVNFGLVVIVDIYVVIVDLCCYILVVGIIVGIVGCFGGMFIVVVLCSYFIVICEVCFGFNGLQVIEQEVGIEEYDFCNWLFIWSMIGGEICVVSGLVDVLVNDGVNVVKIVMNEVIVKGVLVQYCSDNYDDYLCCLSQFDICQQVDIVQIKQFFVWEDK